MSRHSHFSSSFSTLTVVLLIGFPIVGLVGCKQSTTETPIASRSIDTAGIADPVVKAEIIEAVADVEAASNNVEAWFELARRLHANHLDSEAEGCYQRVLELNPGHRQATYLLAHLLARGGRIEDALALARSLSEAGRGDMAVERSVAEWALELGDFELAEAAGWRTVVLAPERPDGHILLAQALLRTDRPAEALKRLDLVGVEVPLVDYLRGQALMSLGRRDEAEPLLSGSSHQAPIWPDPLLESLADREAGFAHRYEEAQQLFESNRFVEASVRIRELRSQHPDSTAAATLELLCWRGLGRFDEALAGFEKLLEGRPSDPELLYQAAATYAMAAQAMRRAEYMHKALVLAEAATRVDPLRYESHGVVGGVLLWLGRLPEALEAFEKCAEIAPISPAHCKTKVANTLILLGEVDEGLEVLRQAFEAQPLEPAPAVTYAVQLRDAGKTSELEELLRRLEEGGSAAEGVLSMIRSALSANQRVEAPTLGS